MEKEIINKRLSELKTSEEGVITKVFGHGSFRNRITEMGFVRGKTVRVIKTPRCRIPSNTRLWVTVSPFAKARRN